MADDVNAAVKANLDRVLAEERTTDTASGLPPPTSIRETLATNGVKCRQSGGEILAAGGGEIRRR
jgi:hypothetical protein